MPPLEPDKLPSPDIVGDDGVVMLDVAGQRFTVGTTEALKIINLLSAQMIMLEDKGLGRGRIAGTESSPEEH